MRANNPYPPDPYGKPPPSLKSATLRRDWYGLPAEAREAFWKEHHAGEENSDTQPDSDSDLTSPSKLLRELPNPLITRAAPHISNSANNAIPSGEITARTVHMTSLTFVGLIFSFPKCACFQ
jgi:hypothetical protein